jgi:hypothetical protein
VYGWAKSGAVRDRPKTAFPIQLWRMVL